MAGEDDSVNDHVFALGDLVWAKMKGFPPWPGLIADPKGSKPKKGGNAMWIYFFGSQNYSWIDLKNLNLYVPKPLDLKKSSKLFRDACAAIEDVYNKGKDSPFNPLNTDDTAFDRLVSDTPKATEPSTSKPKTPGKKKSPKKSKRASSVGAASDTSEVSDSGKKKPKMPRKSKVIRDSEVDSDASEASSVEKTPIVKQPKKRASSSAVSNAKRSRTQHSDADTTTPTGWTTRFNSTPTLTPRRSMTANPLLDRPSLVCPEAVQLNVEKVSQTLIEKNIVPSDLQFGFLGLGNMGSGIVKNLLNSGHRVVIWNRTSDKTKEFIKAGARVAETPQDVVQMADITFSCVSDTQAARDMMFGNCSALDEISEAKAYVEMSTIDAETSKILSDAVTSRGGRYLEAQIQGSRMEAAEGKLLILSAGDKSLYTECQSCFEAIGRCSFFFGEVGSAAKMNLVIQLMSGVYLASCAEALALGDKLGLQLTDVLEVLGLTKLSNPYIQEKGKNIVHCNFGSDHALRLMQKDLSLVINMSQAANQPVPLAAVTNELYKHAKRLGYGDHDSSAVFVGTRF